MTTRNQSPGLKPDADPNHAEGASNGTYLESLPDTRQTHDDPLNRGVAFTPQPGTGPTLYYKVHINKPGRYYVWVRTHSTGTEDNGIHVGLDGDWPEQGARMQWTAKRRWFWDCKQRTEENHTGVPMQIWLDIDRPGTHTVMFSMREDGFEFDKFLLTQNDRYDRPQGTGPEVRLKSGGLPETK